MTFDKRARDLRSAALKKGIKRQIGQRTWGLIQKLHVEMRTSGIVIRGNAPSYYFKQLALQGIPDAIGNTSAPRVAIHIQVTVPQSVEP